MAGAYGVKRRLGTAMPKKNQQFGVMGDAGRSVCSRLPNTASVPGRLVPVRLEVYLE